MPESAENLDSIPPNLRGALKQSSLASGAGKAAAAELIWPGPSGLQNGGKIATQLLFSRGLLVEKV